MNSTKNFVCLSKHCIGASNRIFEYMDDQIDPCEDFNKFACGGFIKTRVIPDAETQLLLLFEIRKKIETRMRKEMEKTSNEDDFDSYKMAKSYYKSCLDEEKQNTVGVASLKSILTKVGGWPILEGNDWNDTNYNIWDQNIKLKHMGIFPNHFGSFSVHPVSFSEFGKRTITLHSASFGLNKVKSVKTKYCIL